MDPARVDLDRAFLDRTVMPGTHLPLNTNRRMAAWTPLPTPAAKAMATAEAVLAAVYGGGTDSRRPKDTF